MYLYKIGICVSRFIKLQAQEAGYEVEVTTAPFQKNPKAILKGETQGMVKIVANNRMVRF